jgi:hypothetical protein
LVDESHFHLQILACEICRQTYLSVFTERVDWVDGDDPQSWSLLPLTRQETAGLSEKRVPLTGPALERIGPGRRCLRVDHPKASPRRIFWSTGLYIIDRSF